ncbi:hypothetical protein I549_1223 [Mycobacterium avium subsp. avium 2285 (R)]|nr:hypothetical protein I549_1223 [Mycobacterium avium subsp. avium 2285 (R)]
MGRRIRTDRARRRGARPIVVANLDHPTRHNSAYSSTSGTFSTEANDETSGSPPVSVIVDIVPTVDARPSESGNPSLPKGK